MKYEAEDNAYHTYPLFDEVLDHYTTKTAEEFVEKVKRGFPLMEPYNTTYRKHAVEYFFAINERTEEKEKILAEGGLL